MATKKILLKIWRVLKRFLIAITAFVALYYSCAYVFTWIPSNSDFKETPNGYEVYLISNGMHVDICFHKEDINKYLSTDAFELDADYIEYYSIGWGDKGFYLHTPTWDDLTVSTAAYAALWPSPTAMHMTYLYDDPVVGKRVKKVRISQQQLKAMAAFIDNSFEKSEKGAYKKINVENDYYPQIDEFFEANGSYIMFYTCNTWTNQCLKEGGVKTATWTPFEWGVLYHFEE